jgi:hypothetical protein
MRTCNSCPHSLTMFGGLCDRGLHLVLNALSLLLRSLALLPEADTLRCTMRIGLARAEAC